MTSQDKFANKRPIFGVSKAANFVSQNRKKIFISLLVLILLGFGGSRIFAATGVPQIMSYQGRLTDSSGTLLGGTGTNYYFRFSIWDNATVGNGTRLWPSTAPASTTINVANGVFNVNIGDTAAGYPDVLNYNFMNSSDAFLQVEVSSDGVSFETLAPRQRIASTGFAINAGTLSGNLQASSTADFTFNVLNLNTGKASFNIATGSLLFGGTVRVDYLGQGTFTTSTIMSLTVSGTSTFQGLLTYGSATGTSLFGSSLVFATGTFASVTSTNLGVSGLLTYTNATGTNLFGSSLIFATGTITFATTTNLNFTAATGTSLSIQNIFSTASTTITPNGNLTMNFGAPYGALFNIGSSSQVGFIATSSPTNDMVRIINSLATGINTAGTNALQITYFGSSTAAIEASAQRIDLTPGTGAGSTWNGFRIVAASTTAGTIMNGIKIDSLNGGLGGAGLERAIFVDTGWDTVLAAPGTPGARTTSSLIRLGSFLSGGNASGTILSMNYASTTLVDFMNIQLGSSSILKLDKNGLLTVSTATISSLAATGSSTIASLNFTMATGTSMVLTASGTAIGLDLTGFPQATSTDALLEFGPNNIVGGSASGTAIGANFTGGSGVDFINFQTSSSQVFKVDYLGQVTHGTTTVNGNLNIASGGALQLGGNVRIDSLGQGTLTTTTISSLSVSGTATFTNLSVTGALTTPQIGSSKGTGQIFYDSNSGRMQVIENGVTKQLCNNLDGGCATSTAAIALSGLMAATSGNTINNLNNSQVWNWTVTSTGAAGLTLGESAFSYASGTPSILKIATLASSTATGLIINNAGTSNALAVTNSSGLSDFVIGNRGNLTINAFTSDVVKSTTGSTLPSDYSDPGSTLQNVTSTNNYVTISDGIIPNGGLGTFSTGTNYMATNPGLGSHTILRDDGDYLIVTGSSTATASVWDGTSTLMSTLTVATGATLPGVGSISLRRPDGTYLLIHGNSSAGLTSIFDPFGIKNVVAGPVVCGSSAMATGTNAFQRDDGRYVILCGGTANWGVYDPTVNTYTTGTAAAGSWGAGAHALHRDDGTFLVFQGGGSSNVYIYQQYSLTNTGYMGLMSIANSPVISQGAITIRRQDGKFLILPGASTSSVVYDPVGTTNASSGVFTLQTGAGFGPTTSTSEGSQILWRPDGKYVLIIGNATTTTNIIDESKTDNTQFTLGPSLPAQPGPGLNAFIRPDGKYMLIRAFNATTTDVYDEGFVMGGQASGTQLAYYESECVTSTALNVNSTLNWSNNSEGKMNFQVRTGTSCPLSAVSYKDVKNSGDQINPAVGDNRVQMRVYFQRFAPIFQDQEWGLREGRSQTRYRRLGRDPSMYNISVSNGSLYRKNQFDFGLGAATSSGPILVNIENDGNGGLTLPNGTGAIGGPFNDTQATTTNNGYFFGSFSPHTTSTVPVAFNGTVVMKRPDGKFVILVSTATGTPSAQIYDPLAESWTPNSSNPTTSTKSGALAFKRPDGKFLVVLGNATTTTNIYDPIANTFTLGPALTGAAGRGSLVMPLPTGRVLIMHGNFTQTSSIYDPVNNYFYPGPTSSVPVGAGSVVIPRPNGQYLLIPGMATDIGVCSALQAATNIFDPYSMSFAVTGAPAITTGQGPGGFAFQRSDGQWVIVHGGATTGGLCAGLNSTNIYNPITNKMLVGATLGGVAQEGAEAIPRPDGNTMIIHGGALQTTSIYFEKAGAFTADGLNQIGATVLGPNNPYTVNGGSIAFPRDDGKFIVIDGQNTTTTATSSVSEYDGGWVVSGTYRSEEIQVSDLDSASTLVWQSTNTVGGSIIADVKTASTQAGLQTALYRDIPASGGLINPNPGDTWIQINFYFKRKMPVPSGIYTDVWYNGGSAMNMPWITPAQPTLKNFSITKDVNLVNLQADGLSLFRVTSNGDIYSSNNGTINTGGADLAERYLSDTPLEAGTVVSVDPMNNHGVLPVKYQYQPDMLGVVSTAPGFVAGAYTDNSYPIALVGRVPVKVSTENGMIKAGDRVTAASVPGYAMKATLAGRVLGVALEGIDESTLTDCPQSDISIPGRQCTTIMVFVNLVDYQGDSVDLAMEQWNQDKAAAQAQLASDNGLALSTSTIAASLADGNPVDFSSLTGDTSQTRDEQILNFLSELKAERDAGVAAKSEIFTDRLSAVSEIISPNITANLLKSRTILGLSLISDTIQTKNLSADTISGNTPGGLSMSLLADGRLVMRGVPLLLSSSTNVISGLASAIDTIPTGISTSTGSNSSSTATSSIADVNTSSTASSSDIISTSTNPGPLDDSDIVISFDPQGNAFFAGELIAGTIKTSGLTVTGPAVFSNGLIVDKIGAPETALTIMSTSTTFFGRPYFNSDMGGFVVVTKGTKSVDVAFAQEYLNQPVVNASISLETQGEENAVFDNNMQFVITNKSTKGFTIIFNKPAPEDIKISWIALAITNAQTFFSSTSTSETTVSTSSSAPVPSIFTPIVPSPDQPAQASSTDNSSTTPPAGTVPPNDSSTTPSQPTSTPPVIVNPESSSTNSSSSDQTSPAPTSSPDLTAPPQDSSPAPSPDVSSPPPSNPQPPADSGTSSGT